MFTNVVHFVSRQKYPLLSLRLMQVFPVSCHDYATRCSERGVVFVGQAIRHTEGGFFEKFRTNDERRAKVLHAFNKSGLNFGSVIPNWKPPVSIFNPDYQRLDLGYR